MLMSTWNQRETLLARGDDEPFPFRREKPKNTRYHQQGRNIANEVTLFLSVGKGLHRHDQCMHDARPDGESDQAAIGSRVPRWGDQEDAQHRIDAADHLEIVIALPAVPDPARSPDQPKGIDQQEDNSEGDERRLQIFFSGLVVHDLSLVGSLAITPCRLRLCRSPLPPSASPPHKPRSPSR